MFRRRLYHLRHRYSWPVGLCRSGDPDMLRSSHKATPASIWQPLSHFFLLPNVCSRCFRSWTTGRSSARITTKSATESTSGVHWIFRGLTQLILYRAEVDVSEGGHHSHRLAERAKPSGLRRVADIERAIPTDLLHEHRPGAAMEEIARRRRPRQRYNLPCAFHCTPTSGTVSGSTSICRRCFAIMFRWPTRS